MYKELIESMAREVIGNYAIVRSVEQEYWDNGQKYGIPKINYDVCLDGGDGDIVASFDKLNEARKWAKEN